jgi:hypothetical protein
MKQLDRTARIPEWTKFVSLVEVLEELPFKETEYEVVTTGFLTGGLPDPYGDSGRRPLSWYWRALPADSRVILEGAWAKQCTIIQEGNA